MLNSRTFFSNPATSPGQVYYQVLKIFGAEWQTFVGLLLACVAPWVLFIPFAILIVGFWAFHYAPASVSSDFDKYSQSDNIFGDDSVTAMMHQLVILAKDNSSTFSYLWLLFFGLFVVTLGTCQGATIRAVVEIYTGKRPSWLACLKVGRENMCKMFCFAFLIMFYYSTALVIIVVVVLAFIDSISLLIFICYVVFCIFGATMISGPSMIVVEGKSVIEATESSWHLCKTDIFFICCTTFCFALLQPLANLICYVFLSICFSPSGPATTATVLDLSPFISWLAMLPINCM